MIKITFSQFSQKKRLLMSFFILSSLFIYNKAFAGQNLNMNDQSASTKTDQVVPDRPTVISGGEDIVVKGAKLGDVIKVYTFYASLINTTIVDSDPVHIKVPKGNLYIVVIGDARYIVFL